MQTKHDMKAILGEDFFKEEIRCDFRIPTFLKKCWAVELDLYFVFADICERHNLQYFMMLGGLLGAIRHNGFIPWDDDLDVCMPRKDYEEFVKIAPSELAYPYFLRTPYTDPTCLYPVIDLMNSETTFIPRIFRRLPFNKGIGLDIFPLDFCDPLTRSEDREKILVHYLRCTNWMKKDCTGLNERQLRDLVTYKTNDPIGEFETVHRIASDPKYINSDYLCIANWVGYKPERMVWPRKCFESSLNHKFENFEVKIPVGYDEILKILYGNYMEFPPVKERGAKNYEVFIDPDHPYTYYKDMPDEQLLKLFDEENQY